MGLFCDVANKSVTTTIRNTQMEQRSGCPEYEITEKLKAKGSTLRKLEQRYPEATSVVLYKGSVRA